MKTEACDYGDPIYRWALDQCDVGVVITDLDGTIRYINQRQADAYGASVEALIGQHSRIFNSGCTLRETYEHLWATILAGQVWSGELLNRRANGELYRELLRISPLKDESGRVRRFLAVKEESLTRNRRSLAVGAGRDALTGLFDRAGFLNELAATLALSRNEGSACALMLCDLDQFHRCNHALGQSQGDLVLAELAHRLSGAVRDDDLVGRVCGDEFAVLITDLGLDAGGQVEQNGVLDPARRLQGLLEKPVAVAGREVRLSVSMGIALYPGDGANLETLLRAAEAALRAVKQEGGGIGLFQPNMMPGEPTVDLRSELNRAVEQQEFLLHYQPKINLASGRVVGLEALVRWRHPERGMVSPGQFIPQAEENGAIVAITEWVIHEVCRQLAEWRSQGRRPTKVSINLSARDFHSPRLMKVIADHLAEFQLPAGCLDLELTEGTMMRDPAAAARVVDAMKAMGLTVSLDDFGTGYSSLAYLSRFAIDCLKIDQSFIRDITTNPANASIATATIAMAHQLGKSVVAEGIETEAQMEYLRRHDCDEGQGYLFARPVPASEVESLLDRVLTGYGPVAENDQPQLLLVDDEPNILASLRRLFRREGYQVWSANNAREALELLALHPIRVIVSDQRMPEMSGVELLSRVKSLYPDTVRIILSGYSDIATVTEAVNRGAVYKYFTKPWDDQDLKREIRAAVRGIGDHVSV